MSARHSIATLGLLLWLAGAGAGAQLAPRQSPEDSLAWNAGLDHANRHPDDSVRAWASLTAYRTKAQQAGEGHWVVEADLALGYRALTDGRLVKSQERFGQALQAARSLGDSSLVVRALVGAALANEWAGLYDGATHRLTAALQAAQTDLDRNLAYIRTGDFYRRQKQFDNAKPLLDNALAIGRKLNHHRAQGDALLSMGSLLQAQGQDAQAEVVLQQAIYHFKAQDPRGLQDSVNRLRAQSALVKLYTSRGNRVDANQLAQNTIPLAHQVRSFSVALLLEVGIYQNWIAMGKGELARAYLERFVNATNPDPPYAMVALHQATALLSELLVASDPALALSYYRQHVQWNDSLIARNASHSREIQEFRYQSSRLQQDQELMDKERELAQARSNLLLGLIAAVVLVVLFLLWRAQGQARTNATLKRQTKALATANNQINHQMRLLDEQAAALQLAMMEKDEVIGIAAHDLKNPIAAVRIFATLLRDSAERLTPVQVEEFAGKIVQTSDQMMDIVRNLLDINQIEQGRLELAAEPVDAGLLADQVVAQYLDRAELKAISLQFETAEDLPEIHVDARRLVQVLDNLLSNAIKFTPRGGTVILRVVLHDQNLRFEVRDTGPGLQPEDHERLFQKFAKLSARPTAGESSSGLGLSIVHKLVTLMGGTVLVESVPGQGAAFIVEFSLAAQAQRQVASRLS